VDDVTTTDLYPEYPTPPAALSTLGAKFREQTTKAAYRKMAQDMADSTVFTDDQYDMIDELSELSNDDRETASIASSDEDSEDGYRSSVEEDTTKEQEVRERENARANAVIDSIMSEDELTTPRQSTMPLGQNEVAVETDKAATETVTETTNAIEDSDAKAPVVVNATGKKAAPVFPGWLAVIIAFLMALSCGIMTFCCVEQNLSSATRFRREALVSALDIFTNSTDATQTFNIDHLLPMPVQTNTTDILGRTAYVTQARAHYQGMSPNLFVVSLPKGANYLWYPQPKDVVAARSNRTLACNSTKLVDGVYAVTIDPAEAYGVVSVFMPASRPSTNYTFTHNFGRRILKLTTYEKATTDVSKAVTKDLTVARVAAKSLTEELQISLNAGLKATQNVTQQIAIQVTRELALMANSAVDAAKSSYGRVTTAGNNTATAIRKDLVSINNSVQKGLSTVGKTAKGLVPSKKSLTEPLRMSRERALKFQEALEKKNKKGSKAGKPRA
jgi:hypothetical protein